MAQGKGPLKARTVRRGAGADKMMTQTLVKSPVIRLDPADNVVVAREDLPAGLDIAAEGVTTRHDVPQGHKIATRAIPKGDPVLKYATVIGFPGADIQPGDWNSRAVIHNGLICMSGIVADDKSGGMKAQTADVLAKIDGILAQAGSDKTKIMSAVVYVSDMNLTDEMNEAWM